MNLPAPGAFRAPAGTRGFEHLLLSRLWKLLQAQEQELEAVKVALREQQELTARLEAKLSSIAAGANGGCGWSQPGAG